MPREARGRGVVDVAVVVALVLDTWDATWPGAASTRGVDLDAALPRPLGADRNATQGSSFRVGSQVAVVGGQHVLPAAFYKHPRYNRLRAFEMDIGLIRLRWPLRFGRGVEPVPLVDTWAPRLQEDDQLIVTGWGLTKVGMAWHGGYSTRQRAGYPHRSPPQRDSRALQLAQGEVR